MYVVITSRASKFIERSPYKPDRVSRLDRLDGDEIGKGRTSYNEWQSRKQRNPMIPRMMQFPGSCIINAAD
jgi:hypothetical protein